MAKSTFKERFKNSFKRDFLSYPEDIARPHDKIVTYIIKVAGVTLFVLGCIFLTKAGNAYVIYREIIKSEYSFMENSFDIFSFQLNQQKVLAESKGLIENISIDNESKPNLEKELNGLENKSLGDNNSVLSALRSLKQDDLSKLKADLVDLITVFSFISFGFFLASMFLGSVIILRYIARILPDRIYYRFDLKGKTLKAK